MPVKKILAQTLLRILWFFGFVVWPGLNFKFPRKNKFPEKNGNQEKRKTFKTGGRTALLSVILIWIAVLGMLDVLCPFGWPQMVYFKETYLVWSYLTVSYVLFFLVLRRSTMFLFLFLLTTLLLSLLGSPCQRFLIVCSSFVPPLTLFWIFPNVNFGIKARLPVIIDLFLINLPVAFTHSS